MKTLSKTTLLIASLFFSGLIIPSAFAHHSTAGFALDQVVKIEATITRFRWTNPHASIRLEATIDGTSDGIWAIEMTAPNVLINEGWKRSSLKKGDQVTIFAHPTRDDVRLRDGSKGGLYLGAILADGTSLGTVE